jgi:hypothetical protein
MVEVCHGGQSVDVFDLCNARNVVSPRSQSGI